MNSFAEYLQMKEEANMAITAEQIHDFIDKYKCMPVGVIKELQAKLNVINKQNQNKGTGIVHIINY